MPFCTSELTSLLFYYIIGREHTDHSFVGRFFCSKIEISRNCYWLQTEQWNCCQYKVFSYDVCHSFYQKMKINKMSTNCFFFFVHSHTKKCEIRFVCFTIIQIFVHTKSKVCLIRLTFNAVLSVEKNLSIILCHDVMALGIRVRTY